MQPQSKERANNHNLLFNSVSSASLLFLIALLIRLIYLWEQSHTPFFDTPYLDEKYHFEWAQYFADGNERGFLDQGAYFRGPLYPWLLGILYWLFGNNIFLFKIIQMIIGSSSCVLVYRIARKLFNERTAWIAGILMACNPVLIFFNGGLLIENLYVFWVLLALVTIFYSRQNEKGVWTHLVVGFLFGLAAITRPNILIFMPVLVLLYLFDLLKSLAIRKRIICGILLALGVLIPILPVTIINSIRSKDFVLISYQGGINFFIGNNSLADGFTAKSDKRYDYTGHYRDSVELYSFKKMQEETGKSEIKPSEISRYWYKKSWDWIKSNPRDALKLVFKKIVLFFNGYEIPNNKNIYFLSKNSRVLEIGLMLLSSYILMPLGILGFGILARKPEGRILMAYFLCYALSVISFFVCSRYRMPAIPILILFSAVVIDRLIGKRTKNIILFMILFIGLFLVGYVDWYHVKSKFNLAEDEWSLGTTYLAKVTQQVERNGTYNPQDLSNAQIHFEKGIQKYPSGPQDFYILQQIYLDYGKSYYVENNIDQATKQWETILDSYKKDKNHLNNVDSNLLKSTHKNLSICYQDKVKITLDLKEKDSLLQKAQYHLEAIAQITD